MSTHRDQEVLIATEWDLFGGLVRVAATVAPDGTTDLWVLVPGATEGRWQIPAHEHVGPLPDQVARRVAQVLAASALPDPERLVNGLGE